MIKMIIADDESIIVNGIQKLVDWNQLGIEIIGKYEDGKSALTAILSMKPDIALLDINMPEMSGVEILKRISKMPDIPTKVIFISGFQDFEYAKAALNFGASDYLLKPVIEEELLYAIEKCLLLIQSGKNITFLREEGQADEIPMDYSKLVELEQTTYLPVYANISYKKEESQQVQKLIRFSFLSFLDTFLNERKCGITFTKNDNIILVLKGIPREQEKEIIYELWEQSSRMLEHKTFFIIGRSVDNMGEIPESYNECINMKGYEFFIDAIPTPIINVDEKVFSRSAAPAELDSERENIIKAVLSCERNNFSYNYKQFCKLVCILSEGKKEDACYYFCNLVKKMEERFPIKEGTQFKCEMKELLAIGRSTISIKEMEEAYKEVLTRYLDAIETVIRKNENKDIHLAIDYIETHYMENLTLEVMAKLLYMNSYYFSNFFKKASGKNFKMYLNDVRVRHALELSIVTDKKLYEIAEEVGFRDARVLSEAFQKVYGETLASYKKRVTGK